MNFKQEFKAMFEDDYKHIGKYVVKPFSCAWWLIWICQGLLGVIGFYVFCVLMLLALS